GGGEGHAFENQNASRRSSLEHAEVSLHLPAFGFGGSRLSSPCGWRFPDGDRLELVDAPFCHQGEKEVTVFDFIRSDEIPVLHHPIVERAGWALRVSERERSQHQPAWSTRRPDGTALVAIDPCGHPSVGPELDRVFRPLFRRQRLASVPPNPDKLP